MTTTSTKTRNIKLTMNTEHPFLIPTTDLELQRVLTETIAPDGETLWFFLDEICEVLGLSITSMTDIIERLDLEQEMGVITNNIPEKEIESNGDSPKLKSTGIDNDLNTSVDGKTLIISESGLYFLLLHINDPATTQDLLRWISNEVLPSLRTTGVYVMEEDDILTLDDGDRKDGLAAN